MDAVFLIGARHQLEIMAADLVKVESGRDL